MRSMPDLRRGFRHTPSLFGRFPGHDGGLEGPPVFGHCDGSARKLLGFIHQISCRRLSSWSCAKRRSSFMRCLTLTEKRHKLRWPTHAQAVTCESDGQCRFQDNCMVRLLSVLWFISGNPAAMWFARNNGWSLGRPRSSSGVACMVCDRDVLHFGLPGCTQS